MVIKRIQYTVVSDYAETNKKNIMKVMEELKLKNLSGIRYSTYVLDDKKTFMHFVVTESDAANQILTGLETFKIFQTELMASGPEFPPKVENLTLVGSSYELLD
ncbi:MAG: hypothetical protein JWO40_110 [Candidatus Doudnabacteria bacterium]|nr:hypothetical protein [Candidatus Doudnabacteria bacterium]